MRRVRIIGVIMLLVKAFTATLARQFYLKLTKFTRRSNGPKSFVAKFKAGYGFLKDMAAYNWDVIKRCRICLNCLVAENVTAVLVYGDKDVIAALRDLSFETSLKIGILYEAYEVDKKFGEEAIPIEQAAASRDKIIVASIVNVTERVARLQALGVDVQRIVFLT